MIKSLLWGAAMRKSHFVCAVLVAVLGCWSLSCAENAEEWHAKGETAYKAKQYGKAVECYTEVLNLEPNRHETTYTRGVNYYKLGKYGDALADFKKVKDEKKIDHHALNYMGLIYARTGEKAKAFTAFKKATQLDPNNTTYCLNTARAAAQLENLDEAETFYRCARKSASNEHEAREGLRWIKMRQQEKAELATMRERQQAQAQRQKAMEETWRKKDKDKARECDQSKACQDCIAQCVRVKAGAEQRECVKWCIYDR
jgi:tetratricopeptide (TPR) repeat protein